MSDRTQNRDALPTRKCDRCGQTYGGSHYHCGGCDSLDVTGMYGHHSKFCKRTRTDREFHHCGPGNCALETPIPPGATELGEQS